MHNINDVENKPRDLDYFILKIKPGHK